MQIEWWYWILAGISLALLELITFSFYALWFGLAAILVGLLLIVIQPDLTLQLLIWAGLSALVSFLWFKFNRKVPSRQWATNEILGEIGVLSSAIEPCKQGKVRFQTPVLGDDEWICVSEDTIPAGARVRVVEIAGNRLTVTKASK